MSIKKNFFAPLASGLGATRRAAMLLLVMMLTTATAWAWSGNSFIMPKGNVTVSANFAEESYNGTCGNGVYYAYDRSTKTLTISGTGAMTDYNNLSERPWHSYASDIYTVVIGAGVTSISNNAFQNCSNLATVFVYSLDCNLHGNGEWADDTFSNCYESITIYIPRESKTKGFYDSQFSGSCPDSFNITELLNPNGKCGEEELIWVLTGESSNYTLTICGFGEMYDYDSPSDLPWYSYAEEIRTVVIESGVESIDDYAFKGYENLATVSFAPCSSLKTIGDGTFQGCSNLTSITIPAGVKSIGEDAFQGCSKLTSITIAASVTSIGSSAFGNCSNLATVTVYAPSCSLGGNAFANCGSLANIYVFGDKVASYKAATNWSAYAGKITAIPTVNTSYVDAGGTLHEGVEAFPLNNTMTQLPAGTYVVNSDVNAIDRIECMGDVNIILADGKTMTVNSPNYGINTHDYALTIYGQVLGTGTLNVAGFDGIGSYRGSITISGGIVTVTGGNYGIDAGDAPFTINGGTVTATGNTGGISSYSGTITLGLSNATDYIKASSYYFEESGTLKISGTLCDEDGNIYSDTLTGSQQNAIAGKTLRPVIGVSLTKDGDNISATFDGSSLTTVSMPVDITVNSVTYNRPFTAGKPATVMLPFDYTCTGSEGGKFYRFAGVKKENNIWVATMKETGDDTNNQGTLTANTPYLFMPEAESTTMTFPNIPDGGITLCTMGGGNGVTADAGSYWTFKGTYEYMKWTTDTSDPNYNAEREAEIGRVYGFAGVAKDNINVGDFVRVKSGAQIRPMGCYLLWNNEPNAANARSLTRGAAATEEELPQRITVRLVGSNGETTAIGTLNTKTGEIDFSGWYDMSGHKLSGKPTKKGLYINNGRKIVIK